MSTNRTQNYQLHTWGMEDEERLAEINENFAKLDEAAQMVAGQYSGTGTDNRLINLGFTPRAVLLIDQSAGMTNGYNWYGGLAVQDGDSTVLAIAEGGFTVQENGNKHGNAKTVNYYYLALR